MNLRSPRFFIPLLLIFIVLIVGVGLAVLYVHSRSNITVVWQVSSKSFTQQDQQDIQTAWKNALLAPNPNRLAGHEFTIIDAQRQGDWATFSANERVSHNAPPIPTEPLFFLAHRQGALWAVWLPGSPDFCDQLKQLPNTLLSPSGKHYFLGCYQ